LGEVERVVVAVGDGERVRRQIDAGAPGTTTPLRTTTTSLDGSSSFNVSVSCRTREPSLVIVAVPSALRTTCWARWLGSYTRFISDT
jgi:hypothetical protein